MDFFSFFSAFQISVALRATDAAPLETISLALEGSERSGRITITPTEAYMGLSLLVNSIFPKIFLFFIAS